MSSPSREFAVLLSAPDPVEAEMARDLLARRGIPSMLHGQDRDLAELGHAVHTAVARPDLYVPRAALEPARAALAETWDASALTDELALSTAPAEEPERRARPGSWRIVLLVLLLVAVALALLRGVDG
jgi:hypothetical protein